MIFIMYRKNENCDLFIYHHIILDLYKSKLFPSSINVEEPFIETDLCPIF